MLKEALHIESEMIFPADEGKTSVKAFATSTSHIFNHNHVASSQRIGETLLLHFHSLAKPRLSMVIIHCPSPIIRNFHPPSSPYDFQRTPSRRIESNCKSATNQPVPINQDQIKGSES